MAQVVQQEVQSPVPQKKKKITPKETTPKQVVICYAEN
jgi:hypothetical protein